MMRRLALLGVLAFVAVAGRTASADCIASMGVLNMGSDTIPPDGVVFVARSCGGEGVRLHPLSGTARTVVDHDYEIIEFQGLSRHVAITNDVGWLVLHRSDQEFPGAVSFLRVDPNWKRPTSVPHLRGLERDVWDMGCISSDDLVFELDRAAAGLEITWRRNAVDHVRRVGIRSAGDGVPAAARLELSGNYPRAGDILTLTVIEADGTRTPIEPSTLTVPDLEVLAAMTEQRRGARRQAQTIVRSDTTELIAATAGLVLLVGAAWLRRKRAVVV